MGLVLGRNPLYAMRAEFCKICIYNIYNAHHNYMLIDEPLKPGDVGGRGFWRGGGRSEDGGGGRRRVRWLLVGEGASLFPGPEGFSEGPTLLRGGEGGGGVWNTSGRGGFGGGVNPARRRRWYGEEGGGGGGNLEHLAVKRGR